MLYQIILPKKVKKDLLRIDSRYQLRIHSALVSLASDPFIGKKLEGKFKSVWSYRVGSYRIIYLVKSREKQVLLIRVSRRQGVYQ